MAAGSLRRGVEDPGFGFRSTGLARVAGDPRERPLAGECTVEAELERLIKREHHGPAGGDMDTPCLFLQRGSPREQWHRLSRRNRDNHALEWQIRTHLARAWGPSMLRGLHMSQ
ncbi:MAG: hypothetical protein OSB19_15515 [Opitutaceae bacterium]|nr:hypothetical protein [Opitutaceae bacterium]